MSAIREAIVLPILLLTATLLASAQPGSPLAFAAPSLYSLVLGTLVLTALVQSGALDPSRLMHGSRSILANANGAVVLGSLLAGASAVLAAVMPRSGLPRFFVALFLLVLLVNTLVARPDRVRLLRSLAVILGAGLLVKFVILASLSEPAASTTGRVLVAIFDAATFGSIAQDPQPAAAGYLSFVAAGLFLEAASLLPGSPRGTAASAMQLREAWASSDAARTPSMLSSTRCKACRPTIRTGSRGATGIPAC